MNHIQLNTVITEKLLGELTPEKLCQIDNRHLTIVEIIMPLVNDKNAKWLDIGCRDGKFLNYLLKLGFINLYGLDCSRRAISIASIRIKRAILSDAQAIPFTCDSFDIVSASNVLEHCPSVKLVVNSVFYILKTGGFFYTEIPLQAVEKTPTPCGHYTLFQDTDQFCNFFRNFELVRIKVGPSYNGDNNFGSRVQAIWRKL